jgi:hypothetical protein
MAATTSATAAAAAPLAAPPGVSARARESASVSSLAPCRIDPVCGCRYLTGRVCEQVFCLPLAPCKIHTARRCTTGRESERASVLPVRYTLYCSSVRPPCTATHSVCCESHEQSTPDNNRPYVEYGTRPAWSVFSFCPCIDRAECAPMRGTRPQIPV